MQTFLLSVIVLIMLVGAPAVRTYLGGLAMIANIALAIIIGLVAMFSFFGDRAGEIAVYVVLALLFLGLWGAIGAKR